MRKSTTFFGAFTWKHPLWILADREKKLFQSYSQKLFSDSATLAAPWPRAHLALAGDGFVEEQAAAVLLVQAGVLGAQRALAHGSQAGRPQRLEALGREGRRWRGRVGLVAGPRPAPVPAGRAVAGRREGAHRAVVLPRATQAL